MFINFVENETTIGTTYANAQGFFSQIFTGLSPNVHNIGVFGTDDQNYSTATTFVEVYTPAYEIVARGGIILPPTIRIDQDTIYQGDDLVVTGHGIPSYHANIFTEPPLNNYEINIDANGDFSYTITLSLIHI